MARRDVEFNAEGVTLRGWFYAAGTGGAPAPAVVMAHGFSAVKEMYLDSFAEVFAAAGPATGSCGTWRPDVGQSGAAIACRGGLSIHLTKAGGVQMTFPLGWARLLVHP
jgi:fermentation-respiration switch protein FrsA (DUF1100 family)